ncbi:mechanosensitive ion channel family protein [Haloarcula marismortui]|nr:mechanosensitive ion channel [Haloarcula sinaiiensis ATCC 33800]QUJ72564.1 mechanosensitive ion channel family protein [Haloarcula sinaiiensis ATCC 33800]
MAVQGTATPTPAANDTGEGLLELFTVLQRSLEQLVATQGRLVATLILLVVLLLSVVIVPAALSRLRSVTSDRAGDWLQVMADYTPTTIRGVFLRIAQFSMVVLVVVSFLIVWGVLDIVQTVGPYLDGSDQSVLATIQTIVLVMLAFVLSDQMQRWIGRFSQAVTGFTEHQEEILLRLGQVTVFVTIGATIFAVWGIDLSGLLVGAGFLGIVVGLAARQTLGSLIAGFVLMFSRPFTIGDWVLIGEQEGIVTDITVFNTRLENFDGEFVIIPNDRVSDRAVTNRSRKGLLRLTVDIGVDYDTDVDRAMDLAREAMTDIEHVVDSPTPDVVPKDFGDSAVVMELRFWIDHPTPPRKWRAISAVVRGVKATFDEEDIAIPFPQRTLSNRVDAADEKSLEGGVEMRPDGDG